MHSPATCSNAFRYGSLPWSSDSGISGESCCCHTSSDRSAWTPRNRSPYSSSCSQSRSTAPVRSFDASGKSNRPASSNWSRRRNTLTFACRNPRRSSANWSNPRHNPRTDAQLAERRSRASHTISTGAAGRRHRAGDVRWCFATLDAVRRYPHLAPGSAGPASGPPVSSEPDRPQCLRCRAAVRRACRRRHLRPLPACLASAVRTRATGQNESDPPSFSSPSVESPSSTVVGFAVITPSDEMQRADSR